MKRMMIRIALVASVVGLLLVVFASRESRVVPKAHAEEGCSVASLKGAYGFFRTGTVPAGPLAAVGIITFDGAGNWTGRQTIRRNGVTVSDLFTDRPAVGLYEVFPDCTGKFLDLNGNVFAHVVVVDGGKELFGMSLSTGNSVYGVWKKINKED